MPELPEVETIRRQLDKTLVGQRIKKIRVLRKKSFQGQAGVVEGRRIMGVERKAKMVIIRLSGGLNLLIHLKMTGQLIYRLFSQPFFDKNQQFVASSEQRLPAFSASRFPPSGTPSPASLRKLFVKKVENSRLPGKHTRVIIELDKGSLFFNDLRVFGWIKVMDDKALREKLNQLPPDVIDKEFTEEYLSGVLQSSRRAIKLVLMDQKKIGGVGNIYANEALFCAAIDPRRPAKEISNEQFSIFKLYKCLQSVINKGIKYGGATASDDSYVNAAGLAGKYQEHFLVYEQAGKQCSKCRAKIKKVKLGGRGTYFCPRCQR